MNKVNLVKHGFTRWPEEDFSDDGNRFQCYKAGSRVRVSKLVADGYAYIAARIDGSKLPYETYAALPHFKALDKLNGVDLYSLKEEDLDELYEACLAYEKEYDEAEKNQAYPSIAELKAQCERIRGVREAELREAESLVSRHAIGIFTKASEWDLKAVKDCLANLTRLASGFDPETYPQSCYGSAFSIRFVKPDCFDLRPSYYFCRVKEIAEKYA